MNTEFLLRARLVWLVSQPPIEDGALYIRDGNIAEAGRWSDLVAKYPGQPAEDLGDVALLPGLVNAHCHLDYTGMAGMLPPPPNFPDWIKAILAIKAHWSYTEYAASWLKGARQLLESGVTAVVDIEATPELLPESWQATPLRVISCLEMTGVRSQHEPERILAEAVGHMERAGTSATKRTGLSPHALYSTPKALLLIASARAAQENWLMTTHLAESIEEWQMFVEGSGPLYHWLKTQRDMGDCDGASPVRKAHQAGLLQPGLIAVHANYLAPGDAALLGESGSTVVHCPRSHEYFRHAPFPYDELKAAGVRICLGTDSLASVRLNKGKLPTLNLWSEMQLFAADHPGVAPEEIFRMATVNGSAALRLEGADLIAVEYTGEPESLAPYLVQNTPVVRRRWILGEVAAI